MALSAKERQDNRGRTMAFFSFFDSLPLCRTGCGQFRAAFNLKRVIFFSPTKMPGDTTEWRKCHVEESCRTPQAGPEHLTHAAHHHGEAAKHHEAGHHEKAAHHAHTARGHVVHAREHAEQAVKAHTEAHGKK
jgi:hypothetical protein